MSNDARSRLGLVLGFVVFFCASPDFSVAHSAEPGPALDPPLPAPQRLPAGSPVEEPAPAPREMAGPVASMPQELPREEPAPMPREQTPAPPPLVLPSLARTAPLAEVQRLHQEIEGLRMEREAMLIEEMDLITAKELKASKGDESAKLRRRVTDLLVRAAQQSKKPATGASAGGSPRQHTGSPSKPATNKTETPSAKPDQPQDLLSPPTPLPAGEKGTKAPSLSPPGKEGAPSSQSLDNSSTVLTDAPVDPQSLAQSLFLAGDHAAALEAYRKLEQEQPRPDERIVIQYMSACCLRKLGKLDEAAILYREVANSGGSDILIENAQWYLRAMKDRRELEAQLTELRQRRQALMPRKP